MPNTNKEEKSTIGYLAGTVQAATYKTALTFGLDGISKRYQDNRNPLHSVAEHKKVIFGNQVNGTFLDKFKYLHRGAVPWGLTYKIGQLTTLGLLKPLQENMKTKFQGHPIMSDIASGAVVASIQTPMLQFLSNMETEYQAGKPPKISMSNLGNDLKAFPWKKYLLKNTGITATRNFTFLSSLATARSLTQKAMSGDDQKPLTPAQDLASSASGVLAGLVTSAPFDMLKTRKQLLPANHPSISAWKMALNILKNEGPRGFYKGFFTGASDLAGLVLFFGLQALYTKKIEENQNESRISKKP